VDRQISKRTRREAILRQRPHPLRPNEKTLGVKNGSLGTVERLEHGVLQIKLDGEAGTRSMTRFD
jgi:hypothetical protein